MLAASVFLVALACSTAARLPLLKPAIDSSFPVLTGFDCVDGQYHPHPDDSHKFIQCSHENAMVMDCAPAILFWNQNTLQCDYGADQQGIQTQGGQDLNTAPQVLNAGLVNCAGKHDTLHANPQSAFTFIQCDNGVAQVMPCAPNNPGTLVWNNELQRCDYEMTDAVQPPVLPSISGGGETEQVTSGGIVTDFDCQGRHDSHHTNPNSIFSFIQCVHGVAHIMPCAEDHPGTLVWNDKKQECDFPTGEASTVISITNPVVVPEITTQTFNCFGRHDTLFPNPSSVNSFIQCVHSVPVEMPCAQANPGSLVWNDETKQCDFPGRIIPMLKPALTFDDAIAPIDAGFNCNGRTGTLNPYPVSPNFFVQCVHGTSYIMPCPSDLVWNQELQRCNYS